MLSKFNHVSQSKSFWIIYFVVSFFYGVIGSTGFYRVSLLYICSIPKIFKTFS